eukprot:s666_g7.t1
MAGSRSMLLRFYLRVLLFFPFPIYTAIFTTDSTLIFSLAALSVLAIPLHFYWMRKRYGPFITFLVCVYLSQTVLCVTLGQVRRAAHHTAEAVKPDTPIKTISVVMAAHNEHHYLKRTLDSILETTPPEALVEIIVIDDGSEPSLESITTPYSQVKLVRHDQRRGLIKSKVEGGNLATGDMIMSNQLEASWPHCTQIIGPMRDWYHPILRHVNINYKRVVVPLIPILDGEKWTINSRAVGVKMMFDWKLHFKWFDDGNDLVPCMSGGLFGITKQWWHESGEYDYGMNMWGGENIEQSIRIWLCGGEIFVARNSQIGHVFRTEFPYAVNSTATHLVSAMGDISQRKDLRANLQCRDFDWYVKKFWKVFKMKGMLPRESFTVRDTRTGHCLEVTEDGEHMQEAECSDQEVQRWTKHGDTLQSLRSKLCLDGATEAPGPQAARLAKLRPCERRS